jgi:hypothetical protein
VSATPTDYGITMAYLHPGWEWSVNANDYDQLVMLDDNDKPSKAALDAAWPEAHAAYLAQLAQQQQAKQSALAKLAALGLTADEIAALIP